MVAHGAVRATLAALTIGAGLAAGAFSISTQQHEVCILSMVALVFAIGPTIDELTPMCPIIGTMPVGSTYTCWNCLLLTYTICDYLLWGRPPLLLPYNVVNSWAVFMAFNIVRLTDDTFYQRAASWTGYPLWGFHFFNMLFHTLPAVGSTLWFFAGPAGRCGWISAGIPVLATMAFHLLWMARTERSIFLDKTYFECPKWQWILAWATASATHIFLGRTISDQCVGGL